MVALLPSIHFGEIMFIAVLNKLVKSIGILEISFALVCLAFTVIGILCQVVLRTVFDSPIAWMEEALTYAFIWLVFISASYAWKKNSHIRIDAIFLLFNGKPRIVIAIEIVVNILMIVLLSVMALTLLDIIPIESRMKTIALPIRLPKSYFYSIPLFISTISLLITSVVNITNEVRKLYIGTDKVAACQ
ncbi:TRAP transporter small permease [Vibrio hannami]|uniref:TRAP transporter small permease n=1 Tax=Vibrio hannami TaxID=2717094 RepID=UPI003EC041DF